VGAQVPARGRPAQYGWHPGGGGTPLEEVIVASAAAGELVDLAGELVDLAGELVDRNEGSFTHDEMQAWGPDRTVDAAVLRHLLIAGKWPVHAKGVRLRGVRISGLLDLEAATLRCPLWLDCCYLDAVEPACFDHATASRLILKRCRLAGLTGEMLTARALDLSYSTLTTSLQLTGADITGSLSCHGTHLDGTGEALVADGIKVGGDMFLDEGFTAAGTISLRVARVGASVHLRPAALAGENEVALYAPRAQIAGRLDWAPAKPVSGQVDLEGTTVGQLDDDWSGERSNGHWPTDGRLRLDGFTYRRFGGKQQATVKDRLDWICSQYQRPAADSTANFASQPYEQLAAVYRQAGQDTEARKVAIARRADLRTYGHLNPYRRFVNWLLDWTIKYGYQSWRAGIGLAAVFVVFAALSFLAQQHHLMVPVGNTDGLHFVPSATKCTSSYPCFYAIGYAVDTVIPIITVHQADNWGPYGPASWGRAWVATTWIATGLGWALATLLVAGYTGLVRRD
jgi:hypothetical protein